MARYSVPGGLIRVFILLACALTPAMALAQKQQLTVRTAKGDQAFQVEIANTPHSREVGLMLRRELAADAGMLFDFSKSENVSMWMKDTLIPLDMLFIRADGSIVNITERTVPGSLTPMDSQGPVLGVLEVNGGTSARLGIRPGDKIIHPIFGTAP
ncbi:MAG: DUF192 domain-containing protein [Alphaproteobacteria bacterium]|nr:DUF192 domain-containing protein [Alphaproteobacteria bacterium]